jgi:hypothetical protein
MISGSVLYCINKQSNYQEMFYIVCTYTVRCYLQDVRHSGELYKNNRANMKYAAQTLLGITLISTIFLSLSKFEQYTYMYSKS